jgi:hypothetical protein
VTFRLGPGNDRLLVHSYRHFKVLSCFMPPYEFPVAIALVFSALFSAFLLFLSQSREGTIKLLDENDSFHDDPFNVTKPEDIVDGEPIDAVEFWRRVCYDLISKI